MKNILYFQSGGPTSVINSSFLGAYKAYKELHPDCKFYYSAFGIDGILHDHLIDADSVNLGKLEHRNGSFTGSLRLKLKDDIHDEVSQKLMQKLVEHDIGYVLPNGGNDSMDTANKICKFAKELNLDIKVIGIPKTIDNDLMGVDHTPGFGTAAKYVANAVISIALDNDTYQTGRVNIVETMGRDAGYLAASSALARVKGKGPDYIFVPEVPFSVEEFLSKVRKTYDEKKKCLVVVSEGIRDKDGVLISSHGTKDSFGNVQIGGVSSYLAALVEKAGMKTRGIELSLLNRASCFVPSLQDTNEAKEVGRLACIAALNGESGFMIGINRVSGEYYSPEYIQVPLSVVAGTAKSMPLCYLNEAKDNINDSFIDYALPLIKGNAIPFDENGLLDF